MSQQSNAEAPSGLPLLGGGGQGHPSDTNSRKTYPLLCTLLILT